MPALESLIALKTVVGIAGVAYSLLNNTNEKGDFDFNKFPEAFLGETFGGIISDCFRDGLKSNLESIKNKYSTINFDKDSLNHDLQKAARKAQLIATFFAAQYCLEEIKRIAVDVKSNGRSGKFHKFIGHAKHKLLKGDGEKYLEEVINYLNNEIRKSANSTIKSLNFEEFLRIFDTYEIASSTNSEIQISQILKNDICDELEVVSNFPTSNFDQKTFEFLKSTIHAGWIELPTEWPLSEHFVTLDLKGGVRNRDGKRYDWFNLVCSVFNEEYKDNPRVLAASQKQLLLQALNKLDKFGALNGKVSNLISQISNFSREIKRLDRGVKSLNTSLNLGFADLTKLENTNFEKIIHEIRLLKPEKFSPQSIVVSLDLNENVFGRDEEIQELFNFLKRDSKHGAIVSPSCFGKTWLIKKFLIRSRVSNQIKTEYQSLFEKVIYIDCRGNQNLQGIIRHFEILMGKDLVLEEGDEINFLHQRIFSQIQDDKILLILDNFETWISENFFYINEEIDGFIGTLFNSNHQIRALFVTQKLPHEDDDFFIKVGVLESVGNELLKGLSPQASLDLVRKEGEDVGLTEQQVSNLELTDFFEKVHYIPQAIQSMIGYLRKTGIKFHTFQKEFWRFEEEESKDINFLHKINKKLRPTRALIKYQVLSQDEFTKHVLGAMAFFKNPAPENVLTIDFSPNQDSFGTAKEEYKIALIRIIKHNLGQIETDFSEENKKNEITFYSLHPFISDVIRDYLPRFEDENKGSLEDLANYLFSLSETALKERSFTLMKYLSECLLNIEGFLFYEQNKTERYNDLFLALIFKGISFTEIDRSTNDFNHSFRAIAEESFQNAIRMNPNSGRGYYNLGVLLEKDKNRLEEAKQCYLKAIELGTHFLPQAYINLGRILWEYEGRWQEAEEYFKKAVQLNDFKYEDVSNAYTNLGWIMDSERNLLEEAETLYHQAIKINPRDHVAHNNLGVLLSGKGKISDAESYYLKALELKSNFSLAYHNFSELLQRDRDRWKEAEEFHHQYIGKYPNNPDPYYQLASLLSKDGSRDNEAEKYYKKAIDLNPNDYLAFNHLGDLYKKDKNNWKNAEESYLKSIEINPGWIQNYIDLGDLYEKDPNRLKEAQEYYCKAIEINPKHAKAYSWIGQILCQQANYIEAIEFYLASANLDKNFLTPRIQLTLIYKKLGKSKEADRFALESFLLLENDAYYDIACLHSILENKKKCLEFLTLAVAEDPSLKSWAQEDSDLEWIRKHKEFWDITKTD